MYAKLIVKNITIYELQPLLFLLWGRESIMMLNHLPIGTTWDFTFLYD
jgi:hypothetical protein